MKRDKADALELIGDAVAGTWLAVAAIQAGHEDTMWDAWEALGQAVDTCCSNQVLSKCAQFLPDVDRDMDALRPFRAASSRPHGKAHADAVEAVVGYYITQLDQAWHGIHQVLAAACSVAPEVGLHGKAAAASLARPGPSVAPAAVCGAAASGEAHEALTWRDVTPDVSPLGKKRTRGVASSAAVASTPASGDALLQRAAAAARGHPAQPRDAAAAAVGARVLKSWLLAVAAANACTGQRAPCTWPSIIHALHAGQATAARAEALQAPRLASVLRGAVSGAELLSNSEAARTLKCALGCALMDWVCQDAGLSSPVPPSLVHVLGILAACAGHPAAGHPLHAVLRALRDGTLLSLPQPAAGLCFMTFPPISAWQGRISGRPDRGWKAVVASMRQVLRGMSGHTEPRESIFGLLGDTFEAAALYEPAPERPRQHAVSASASGLPIKREVVACALEFDRLISSGCVQFAATELLCRWIVATGQVRTAGVCTFCSAAVTLSAEEAAPSVDLQTPLTRPITVCTATAVRMAEEPPALPDTSCSVCAGIAPAVFWQLPTEVSQPALYARCVQICECGIAVDTAAPLVQVSAPRIALPSAWRRKSTYALAKAYALQCTKSIVEGTPVLQVQRVEHGK